MKTKPYTLDRIFRTLAGVVLLAALFFLIRYLSGVLLPFLIGWLLAYMIHPLVKFFQYKLKFRNRGVAVFSSLLLITGILTTILWLLIPVLGSEIEKASTLISESFNSIGKESFLPLSIKEFLLSHLSELNINELILSEKIQVILNKIIPQFWGLLSGSLRFVIGFTVIFIVLLYVVFILLDYEKISEGFILLLPQKYRKFIQELVADLEAGMNKYFRGQSLIAGIVGILFAIGFSIIGLPLAITMGLFIGVLNMVPYLQSIAVIPVIGLTLLKTTETGQSFWGLLLAVFIVFALIQLLQDLVLVPKIIGKATGLNPAIILLSLSVWGALLGMVGMIIALPTTTLLISYYKRFVLKETKVATAQVVEQELRSEVEKEEKNSPHRRDKE